MSSSKKSFQCDVLEQSACPACFPTYLLLICANLQCYEHNTSRLVDEDQVLLLRIINFTAVDESKR